MIYFIDDLIVIFSSLIKLILCKKVWDQKEFDQFLNIAFFWTYFNYFRFVFVQLKDTVAEKCFLPPLKNREIDTKVNQETLFFYEHSTTIFSLDIARLPEKEILSYILSTFFYYFFIGMIYGIDSDRCISI